MGIRVGENQAWQNNIATRGGRELQKKKEFDDCSQCVYRTIPV